MVSAYAPAPVDDLLRPYADELDTEPLARTIGDYLTGTERGIQGCYTLLPTPSRMKVGESACDLYFARDLKDDTEWVVKGALSDQDRFLAMGEAAVYDLAHRPGLDDVTVPHTKYGTFLLLGGEGGPFCTTGSSQEFVENKGTFPNPKWSEEDYFGKDKTDFLVRNQVFDWFIGNFDTHHKNFLVGRDGQYHAIDKGQAFRFYGKDELSHDYYTPKAWTPIYNDMWTHYIEGECEVDFDAAEKVIAAIEAIPDREIEGILRPYAIEREKSLVAFNSTDSAYVKAQDFIDAVIERKCALRVDFERFYAEMEQRRAEHESRNDPISGMFIGSGPQSACTPP